MEETKKTEFEHDMEKVQTDALRFGLHGVKSDVLAAHPLQSLLHSRMKEEEQRNRMLSAVTYGSACAMRMELDSQILSRFQRPAGALQSSMLGLEAMNGSMDSFGVEDFNDPFEREDFRPADIHHGMEVRLGLSKGPVSRTFI